MNINTSNIGNSTTPGIHRRGSLQLWQFLLALLNDPANQAAIVWTGRGMEFKLIEPEEVNRIIYFKYCCFSCKPLVSNGMDKLDIS